MRPMSAAPAGASFSMSVMARAMARGSPESSRSDRVGSGMNDGNLPAQQLPRNHETLNFARPFANRAQFDVAEEFLGRIVFDEPVPAVNLHALLGRAHGDF